VKAKNRERQKSSAPDIQMSGCSTPKFSLNSISLYSDIEQTLKKIDPTFQLFLSNQSPISQILQCVRQAVHFLLQQKKKNIKDDKDSDDDPCKSLPCEHCGKYSKTIKCETALLTQRSEKFKQKSKKFEKQKLIHCEKIKEERKILNIFKEKLESLAERLSSQKLEILAENKESQRQKCIIQKVTDQSITSSKPFHPILKNNLNIEKLSEINIESEIDFSLIIEQLEEHIQLFNEITTEKEKNLQGREKKVEEKEELVKKQLSDIELITLSLNNSKKDCFDLKQKLFPKIEVEMDVIKNVFDEVNRKKLEIEEILENFEGLAQKNRSWAEFHYLRSETHKKYKENCEYNDYLIDMQERLDGYYAEKDKELKENGEKLMKLQENVNSTIQVMEKKEKEIIRLGEKLKSKEESVLKRTKSMKDNVEEPNLDHSKTPKYSGNSQHSRYFKSMHNLKSMFE
jgi:hypothetical protein